MADSADSTGAGATIERRGHVMVITINRPEARNAMNAAVAQGIGDGLEQAQNDPDVRAIVLTGAGDKSFCAGADLKAISRGESLSPAGMEKWGFGAYVQHYVDVPTIAAVNGTALGGGTELALASDLVVASESATFGLPEVKRGLIAGAGGVFRLPAQIPQRLAMEMMLTGDPITADRALEVGLINQVVPAADSVVDAAVALAERIAVNAPLSVQASKRIALGIHDGTRPSEDGPWQHTAQEWIALMQSEDAKEGPLAFAQKRAPVWKAR